MESELKMVQANEHIQEIDVQIESLLLGRANWMRIRDRLVADTMATEMPVEVS